MFKFSFEAMGTKLEIQIFDEISGVLQEKIKSEIFNYTIYYDETFSRFKPNSLITRISKNSGRYTIPKELYKMVEIYQFFFTITDGTMSPLVGRALADLGYDSEYTLVKKDIISQTPKLDETIKISESHGQYTLETKENIIIDVGALGKGFWVDKIREIMNKNNLNHFLIDGSGDIFYSTPKNVPLTVHLEQEVSNTTNNTSICNQAICGSGTNKRNWSLRESDNLHHIIDANSGQPTENIESVWIKVPANKYSTTYADALTTAIFFTEPESLQNIVKEKLGLSFEYYIVFTNKKILFSKNFF